MADDLEYDIASSDDELGGPPELGKELLVIPEWLNKRGRATAFVMCELTTGEHDEFDRSDKVFDKFGQIIRLKTESKNYEWLARCTRDGDGLRIWQSAEAAKKRLEPLGKLITNKMVETANKVNYGDKTSADEAVADAEGNSEEA